MKNLQTGQHSCRHTFVENSRWRVTRLANNKSIKTMNHCLQRFYPDLHMCEHQLPNDLCLFCWVACQPGALFMGTDHYLLSNPCGFPTTCERLFLPGVQSDLRTLWNKTGLLSPIRWITKQETQITRRTHVA